jgi:hypothetical protein
VITCLLRTDVNDTLLDRGHVVNQFDHARETCVGIAHKNIPLKEKSPIMGSKYYVQILFSEFRQGQKIFQTPEGYISKDIYIPYPIQ